MGDITLLTNMLKVLTHNTFKLNDSMSHYLSTYSDIGKCVPNTSSKIEFQN